VKLTFHSIRAKNFLQIGNEFETFNLQKSPFTVIVGKNGSGKSTILDMITYVLYNKAYRPKVTLGQLINSVNKKQLVVEVALTAGSTTYVVRRGEKPKIFEIYKDKELIKPDPSIGDMQTYLEENILKQNYKTFCQINVIGKATYKQFMTLTPAERRSVVEDILDSNIYTVMANLAKADYKQIQNDIKDLERDCTIAESKISTAKDMIKKYQQDRESEIADLQSKIVEEQKNIDNNKTHVDYYQNQMEETRKLLEKTIPSEHRTKFREQLQELISEKSVLQNNLNRYNTIISKIDSMEKCSHCLQVVDDNHKKEIVNQNQHEADLCNTKITELESKLQKFNKIKQNFDDLNQHLTSIEGDLRTYANHIQTSEKSISIFNDRIDALNKPIDTTGMPDINDLQSGLEDLVNQKDINILKGNNLKQAIGLLGDDGIKSKLIGKYIPLINKSVNDYLERMNMFVEFTLDSEFNESIQAINRQSFTYHSFSEGQKMRIDLAILLTWRKIAQMRNSMTTNLFMLDEIADGSLDQEGMDEFLNILREVSDAQNTFLISHKDSTIDLFDNVIRAETVGNFTRYTHE